MASDSSSTPAAWSACDRYVAEKLFADDPALREALAASEAAGLPAIQVSATQGKFLQMLARVQGARRVLEIGTLGGYSTIWLARGVGEGGRVVSLELEPHHAAVAVRNISRAGLEDRVEVRVGSASESLARLVSEGVQPFDLVFIDADKESYADYFQWSVRLCRPGSVIIADNVIRNGQVCNSSTTDARVMGVRRLYDWVSSDKRVEATTLQTVGEKGYDGFLMARVIGA